MVGKILPPSSSVQHGKLPLHPSLTSVAILYFCHQCLPFILSYCCDLQLVLMCFQGIDFHKLRLVPIISVGAIMIRLWIISLDHYFPLLCWLGAIHLPPPLESQMLLNCLSCTLSLLSLLPPTFPAPVTPHDRHLQSSIYQRPSWAAANASSVCLRTVPKRENTSPLSAVLMH